MLIRYLDSLKSLMQYSVEHYTAAMTLPNMENVSPTVTLGTTHFTIPPIAFPHVRKGRCNLAMLNTGALIRGAILEGTCSSSCVWSYVSLVSHSFQRLDYTKETCFTACRPINQQVIGIFFKSDTNTSTSFFSYIIMYYDCSPPIRHYVLHGVFPHGRSLQRSTSRCV